MGGIAGASMRRAALRWCALGLVVCAAIALLGCPITSLLKEVMSRATGSYTQLSALTLSSGTLTPSFSADVNDYAVVVENDVARLD